MPFYVYWNTVLCLDLETVRSFLYTIVRNLVTDYLRRHYKKQEVMACMQERLLHRAAHHATRAARARAADCLPWARAASAVQSAHLPSPCTAPAPARRRGRAQELGAFAGDDRGQGAATGQPQQHAHQVAQRRSLSSRSTTARRWLRMLVRGRASAALAPLISAPARGAARCRAVRRRPAGARPPRQAHRAAAAPPTLLSTSGSPARLVSVWIACRRPPCS